jgi:putative ABC transport system permease protein
MFKNHFKSALRNIWGNKVFSCINIFGLAIGIACSLLIFLFVKDEISYDRFNKDANHTYRVVQDFINDDGTTVPDATTPPALAPAMQRQIPDVLCATRLFANPDGGQDFLFKYEDRKFNEQKIFFVDSNFFHVFSFQFLKGNAEHAFKDPNSIVITETVSKKYFGNSNPISKTLMAETPQSSEGLMVTGVIKDVPANCHFHFDFAIPLSNKQLGGDKDVDWNWYEFYTYAKLKPQTNSADLTKKIQTIYQRNDSAGKNVYHLQPLTSIHLTSNLKEEIEPNSNKLYVYIFSIIALFIILIAAINYVNLATAKAAVRTKEVGIRKVTGASRSSLISQFLTESIITCLAAALLAVIIAQLLLPVVRIITQKQLTFINNPLILAYLLGLAFLLAIVAGVFPAIYLSSFKPARVLKGSKMSSKGALNLRKILVVVQFTISIVLIIGALIVGQQVRYMRSETLGLNNDQVIIVKNEGTLTDADKDAFRNAALQINGVEKIATSDGVVGGQTWIDNLHTQSSQNTQIVNFLSISDDYLDALGIELKEGRSFSAKFPTDVKVDLDGQTNKLLGSIILNETAVKELGLKEPVVGKNVYWGENYLQVVGVVKDFHFTSFHDEIKSFAFFDIPERMSNYTIKLSTSNIKSSLSQLENTWSKFSPDRPFEYIFLDETYSKLFQSEIHFEQIFKSLMILAILIACLGLFGLATFMAQQRAKEIGIRKVLGASVFTITKLLSFDFIKLVAVSIVIATPIAWYVMHKWLESYAYRINIGWITFFVAAWLAVAIALVTISFQSIQAAIANPVKSLRME